MKRERREIYDLNYSRAILPSDKEITCRQGKSQDKSSLEVVWVVN